MLTNFLVGTIDDSETNERPFTNVPINKNDDADNADLEVTDDDDDDDDDDIAQELRDDSSLRDEADNGSPLPANNSILGDFSVLRDFFLAAFSDGCYKVTCCGSEGLFPGSCISQRRAREISNTDSFGNGSDRDGETPSMHTTDLTMNRSGSYEGVVIGQQRKRPLAVAVGFKYAEDINGRPIVITPGSRRLPIIDRSGAFQLQPSSPASQSVHTKKIDIVSNALVFPMDHGLEA